MSKEIVISSVNSRLISLGIGFTLGNGTDISINQEFLAAGWSAGNKKITYQASAYFNENEKTVYLWELTKEVGSGFSFGSSSESSFQSGKTLFRKVKAVQYGVDGKAYELDLDLGAIPKVFKEVAAQYGWRFKQVLKKEKACYPMVAAFPSKEAPAQTTPIFSPSLQQQSDHSSQSSTQSGKTFSIGFVFLVLFAVILLWLGECSIVGWIISAVLLFVYFLLRRLFNKFGCFLKIIFLVIMILLLFVTFIITATVGDSAPADITSSNESFSSEGTQSVESETIPAALRIDYLSYGLWPGFTYTSDERKEMNLGVSGDITFSLCLNPMGLTNPADKVSKITVSVNVLKPPAYGTVKLYRKRADLATAPSVPGEMNKYSLPTSFDLAVTESYTDSEKPENYLLSYVNFISNGQVSFYYCIENVTPIAPSTASWMDSIPDARNKGITSDSLRSNIGIEILAVMESGEQHRIYFERELMEGDFFSKTRLNNINEDYQGKETPIVSQKVG